jgi:hypothetical protein
MLAGTAQVDCLRAPIIPVGFKDLCATRNVDGCQHERKSGDGKDRPEARPPGALPGNNTPAADPREYGDQLRIRRSKSIAGLWRDRSCDASEYPVYLTGEASCIE